jgi:single-strand DNA-binding protein
MNKVIIIGRLGVDPELRYTPSGKAVANFSVATSERWTDKDGSKQEKTEWHRIVVWGKLAELCNQYLSKGRQAVVEGSLQTRSWEAQDGSKRYTTEIVGKNVQFLAGNGGNQSGAGESNDDYSPDVQQDFTADDIPF